MTVFHVRVDYPFKDHFKDRWYLYGAFVLFLNIMDTVLFFFYLSMEKKRWLGLFCFCFLLSIQWKSMVSSAF